MALVGGCRGCGWPGCPTLRIRETTPRGSSHGDRSAGGGGAGSVVASGGRAATALAGANSGAVELSTRPAEAPVCWAPDTVRRDVTHDTLGTPAAAHLRLEARDRYAPAHAITGGAVMLRTGRIHRLGTWSSGQD